MLINGPCPDCLRFCALCALLVPPRNSGDVHKSVYFLTLLNAYASFYSAQSQLLASTCYDMGCCRFDVNFARAHNLVCAAVDSDPICSHASCQRAVAWMEQVLFTVCILLVGPDTESRGLDDPKHAHARAFLQYSREILCCKLTGILPPFVNTRNCHLPR